MFGWIGAALAASFASQGIAPNVTSPSPTKLLLQWQKPGTLQLKMSFTSEDISRAETKPGPASTNALSRVKLLENEFIAADLRHGRLQYRFIGTTAFGGGLGGEFGTNTAKITLSWPPKS